MGRTVFGTYLPRPSQISTLDYNTICQLHVSAAHRMLYESTHSIPLPYDRSRGNRRTSLQATCGLCTSAEDTSAEDIKNAPTLQTMISS